MWLQSAVGSCPPCAAFGSVEDHLRVPWSPTREDALIPCLLRVHVQARLRASNQRLCKPRHRIEPVNFVQPNVVEVSNKEQTETSQPDSLSLKALCIRRYVVGRHMKRF
jgi:hypothetical protein